VTNMIEDLIRREQTPPPCICGDPESMHTNISCLKWYRCGCPGYHPDDGAEHGGPLGVRSQPYTGFYAGKHYSV
jgi:hypothetical protein